MLFNSARNTKPAWRRAGFVVLVLLLSDVAIAQVDDSSDYLSRMDRDGDRRVSLDEYQDWMGYAFEAMDRDRDGVLVAAELPGGKGRAITRAQHRTRLAAGFARQDRDRNGSLDAAELAAPPQ